MDPAIVRILDVCINRARESLRVIEDHARFILDDSDASAAIKQCRHDLRGLASAIGHAERLNARAIESDVGRDTKTLQELSRTSSQDVLTAAFARLSESLRSFGEYAKLLTPDAALLAERLRYQAYELEQRIALRGAARQRFRNVKLYVIVTESLCSGPWLETAEAALRGGASCLQLREKTLPDAQLLARARDMRDLTARLNALFIVNDRPDIARLAGADGVHVGQDDLAVPDARRIAGSALLIGKSTHSLAQLDAAIAEAPDYLALGPMYPTTTKPQESIPGPATMAQARSRSLLPLVAIGGIAAGNASEPIAAGADIACVCSAVISSRDPRRAAEELLAAIHCSR
jgi:thiamine-phosphate pyrophosphorylase